jgi:serine/threonine protein kinase
VGNRDVAVRVLPPGFADDSARMQRFEREAQVLAALNHPSQLIRPEAHLLPTFANNQLTPLHNHSQTKLCVTLFQCTK